MSKTKTKRKVKLPRANLDVPPTVMVPTFLLAIALIVVLAYGAPRLYLGFTEPTFEGVLYVEGFKDRINAFGTDPELRSIRLESDNTTIEASKVGRRVDEIITIYIDGRSAVSLFGILSGIGGGLLLSVLLIYSYTKHRPLGSTVVIAALLIVAILAVNGLNAKYRSSKDVLAYGEHIPFIQGNLALLSYIAIKDNEPEKLKQFINRGAPLDAVDNQNASYMHHIASLNRVGMFSILAAVPGVNLDDRNETNVTPIQIATEMGYQELVSLFLANDVDAVNKNALGQTLLHLATKNGDLPLMKLLLDKSNTLEVADSDGVTPLSMAIQNVDMEIITLLLDHGTDVNIQVDEQYTFFELILSVVLSELNRSPKYALGDEDTILATIVQAISQDAEVSGQNEEGKTPLHWVTRLHDSITTSDENSTFLASLTMLLLENGADYALKNNAGERALTLEHVIRHNYDEWLLPVIKVDPDYLNVAIIKKRSLFQFAIELGNADTLAILFEHGLKPKEWVPRSGVPLRYAVIRSDLATARLLLDQNLAEPAANTRSNQNGPLHIAARTNQDQMIELLIDYGFKVNQQGVGGNTPLHHAMDSGSTFSILALLEHGADPLIWNSEGVRPFDQAKELGNAAIAEAVKKAAESFEQEPEPKPEATQ